MKASKAGGQPGRRRREKQKKQEREKKWEKQRGRDEQKKWEKQKIRRGCRRAARAAAVLFLILLCGLPWQLRAQAAQNAADQPEASQKKTGSAASAPADKNADLGENMQEKETWNEAAQGEETWNEAVQEEKMWGEETQDELGQEILAEMDLAKIERAVDGLLEDTDFSFSDMLQRLMSGEEELGADTFGQLAGQVLTGTLTGQRKVLVQLIVLVLACAFLSNLSGLFSDGQLWETSFYIVYLLAFALLVGAFQSVSRNLTATIQGLVEFMKILTPAYYLAVAAASGASTATMFYQIVLAVIGVVEGLMVTLMIPAVHVYVLLALINHLSKEEFLSHMTELLETGIQWALKTSLGVLVGLQILRSLIAPALDAFRRTLIGKTATAIPGVGNAVNAVTEMVIGSAVLIRNCFGVTVMLVLVAAGLYPVAELLLTGLSYRVLAAFSQPVCDRRICDCLATVGKGYGLLLKILLTVEVLFLMTIAILAGTFS